MKAMKICIKNKKLLCIAVMICVLVCNTVFMGLVASAQVGKQSETVVLNGIVTFSGITDEGNAKIMYLVKPENATDEDFEALGELRADSDGSFVIEFGLNTSGTYVLDMMDEKGDTYSETIDYVTASDRQVQLLYDINLGTTVEVEKALNELNFTYNEIEFNSLSNEGRSWLVKYLQISGPYENMTKVEEEYKIKDALYEINSAKVAGIKEEIAEHQEFLGLSDNSEINDFVTSSATYHQSALVSRLHENPAYTIDLLISAIIEANDTKKPTTSQGGGGGGGGTSSKNKDTLISVAPEPEKKTEVIPQEEKTEESKTFADMKDAMWANDAVEALVQRGVISGDQNGNFRPNDVITRQEFVKMVVTAFGVEMAENNFVFLDVFDSDWYFEYVGAAYHAGIVKGISQDFFGINKPITRQDASVILKRAADYVGIVLRNERMYENFSDNDDISAYAKDSVSALYRSGVVNGMPGGVFMPQNPCTRAEAAQMIYGII